MNERPWWAPEIQTILVVSIVAICGAALFIRMFHSSAMDDKMLDTMITILFSTCLVTVYNYSFGSSRGSEKKDDTQSKVVEKLMTNSAPNGVPPVSIETGPVTVEQQKKE